AREQDRLGPARVELRGDGAIELRRDFGLYLTRGGPLRQRRDRRPVALLEPGPAALPGGDVSGPDPLNATRERSSRRGKARRQIVQRRFHIELAGERGVAQ